MTLAGDLQHGMTNRHAAFLQRHQVDALSHEVPSQDPRRQFRLMKEARYRGDVLPSYKRDLAFPTGAAAVAVSNDPVFRREGRHVHFTHGSLPSGAKPDPHQAARTHRPVEKFLQSR